ncbi:MAG TPA: hypothetical protein VGD40_03185 [Chryseosolibacter sp.]
MDKKKKLKTRKVKEEVLKPSPERNAPIEPDEEKPFDFGGLPNRDLKKNLGCG